MCCGLHAVRWCGFCCVVDTTAGEANVGEGSKVYSILAAFQSCIADSLGSQKRYVVSHIQVVLTSTLTVWRLENLCRHTVGVCVRGGGGGVAYMSAMTYLSSKPVIHDSIDLYKENGMSLVQNILVIFLACECILGSLAFSEIQILSEDILQWCPMKLIFIVGSSIFCEQGHLLYSTKGTNCPRVGSTCLH